MKRYFLFLGIISSFLISGCGGGSSNSSNVTPPAVSAYVVNGYDDTISMYSADVNGILTAAIGVPVVTTRPDPSWITINPSKTFVYVTQNDPNDIRYIPAPDKKYILKKPH